MDVHDESYFFLRKQTPEHSSELGCTVPTEGNPFASILNEVFIHQPAVYASFNTTGLTAPPCQSELAHEFYWAYYQVPSIQYYTAKDLRRPVLLDDLLANLTADVPENGKNRISYLLGEVGVGKTALINYIITKYGRQFISHHNIWFVRVDLERGNALSHNTRPELLNSIVDKVLRVIRQNPNLHNNDVEILAKKTQVAGLFTPFPADDPRKDVAVPRELKSLGIKQYQALMTALVELVNLIRKKVGFRLLLILDNLDVVVHGRDRELFHSEGRNLITALQDGICELVQTFFHDTTILGSMGAAILIVMRKDSYDSLRHTGATSLPVFEPGKLDAFWLDAPEWAKVIKSRLNLLSYRIDRLTDGVAKEQAIIVLAKLQRHFDSNEHRQLKAHIEKLTNHGCRAMMRFYSRHAALLHFGFKGSRSMEYPAIGLITFMLGNYRRFSQMLSAFPNVYLVNLLGRNASLSSHPHVYWLKRMILEYLMSIPPDGLITCGNVITTFCTGHRAYPEHVVRECLGSLADVNSSNLVLVDRTTFNGGTDIIAVSMTDRGRYFMEHIVDLFSYLQLIVDDWLLPLPLIKDSKSDINFRGDFAYQNSSDYEYIYNEISDFPKSSSRVVYWKARQTLQFLETLAAALEYEQEHYKDCFLRLEERGVYPPKIDAIQSKVMAEVLLVSKDMPDAENVRNILESFPSRKETIFQQSYASFKNAERSRVAHLLK